MNKLNTRLRNNTAEFLIALDYVDERLSAVREQYKRTNSIANIAERMEELADAALTALRWADKTAEVEKLRDEKDS